VGYTLAPLGEYDLTAMYSGDAALCQITLTTSYCCCYEWLTLPQYA